MSAAQINCSNYSFPAVSCPAAFNCNWHTLCALISKQSSPVFSQKKTDSDPVWTDPGTFVSSTDGHYTAHALNSKVGFDP